MAEKKNQKMENIDKLTFVSAALILAGFGAVSFISTGNTLVQTSVADSIRGRIMGIWALAFGGSLPLGSFLAGGIAEFISPFTTIQIFSVILLAASIVIYLRLPSRTVPDMLQPGTAS